MNSVNVLEEHMVAELDWSDEELKQCAQIGKLQYLSGQVISAADAISHFRAL